MELLDYTSTATDNGNKTIFEIMPSPGNVKKHISIHRLNSYMDRASENYYRILWILDGVKTIQVDMEKISSYPNLIVFISPGKKLKVSVTENPQGWVLNFSNAYLNLLRYENFTIGNMDFFSGSEEIPKIVLSPKIGERIHSLAGMIDELEGSHIPKKEFGIHALLKTILVYCDSKCNVNLNKTANIHEVNIVSRFKQLVTENFTRLHMVSDYAGMMKITPKYLNQVVKQIIGVTAKQVIQEQIIIQARKELKFSNRSIKEIAYLLGFLDPFHFSSFFKELTGTPPTQYRQK